MKAGCHSLFPLLFFIFASCSIPSGMMTRSGTDSIPLDTAIVARDLVLRLKQTNMNLDTFKGVGSISLRHRGAVRLNERIAWIGATPSRLRMVVLASGHPIIKLASDGAWLYIHDHRDPRNTIRKIPAHDASLRWLIPLPIGPGDLVSLLAGRIPIGDHHSADLIPDTFSGGKILILKRWWWIVQKIYLDKDGSNPNQVEVFNWTGSLRYRARLEETQPVGEYHIPMEIKISNAKDTGLVLDIDRYWANVSVSSSLFVLNGSD